MLPDSLYAVEVPANPVGAGHALDRRSARVGDSPAPGFGGDMTPGGPAPARPTDRRRRRRRRADRPFMIVSIVGIAVLVGFVAFAVVHSGDHHPAATKFPVTKPSSLRRGAPAPAFTLPRLGGGAPVSQATAAGKPMMINFFASWCPDCRAELKAVATVAARSAGTVAVIGIDTSDRTPARAQELLGAVGADYPVGVDPTARVAQKYRITGLPVTYFVSARDRVVGVAFGAQTHESLDRWVQRLSSGAGT